MTSGALKSGLSDHLGLVVVEVERRVLHVGRAGQIVQHGVEQGLDALVLEGRPDEHRGELERERALADRFVDHVLGHPVFEIRLHQVVAEHRHGVEHQIALFPGLSEQGRRDFLLAHDLAVGSVEIKRLHADQVDHSLESRFEPDGNLHQHGVVAQLVLHLVDDLVGIGAHPVAFVDEGDARHLVPLHLPVHGQGLRLHAADGAEHEDGAVEHAQRPLDLDREIDVAGRVDDVDGVLLPVDVGGGGGDRDAALAFEVHGIHGRPGFLVVHLVDGVDFLGVIEDALGQGRLARIDVRADADVPHFLEVGKHNGLFCLTFPFDQWA